MKLIRRTSQLEKIILSLVILFIVISSYILFVPKKIVGDVFFGSNVYTYSLPLARFFYRQSILFDSSNDIPPLYSHYQLGRIAFLEGKFDTALDYFDTEQKFHPDNYKVYYMRGLTLGYENRNYAAIASFEEFNRLVPNTWAGINDEAWLLYKVGDLKKARNLVEAEYQKGNMSPWILNTYGVILLNEGECEAAGLVLAIGQSNALAMNKEAWGRAYPGNSPQVYQNGLDAMRETFAENIKLSKNECKEQNVEK